MARGKCPPPNLNSPQAGSKARRRGLAHWHCSVADVFHDIAVLVGGRRLQLPRSFLGITQRVFDGILCSSGHRPNQFCGKLGWAFRTDGGWILCSAIWKGHRRAKCCCSPYIAGGGSGLAIAKESARGGQPLIAFGLSAILSRIHIESLLVIHSCWSERSPQQPRTELQRGIVICFRASTYLSSWGLDAPPSSGPAFSPYLKHQLSGAFSRAAKDSVRPLPVCLDR